MLYFMGLDDELEVAIDWIENDLDFDVDGYVSVFETNIRLVGGLLSGHMVTGNTALLDHAQDLADRLLPAGDGACDDTRYCISESPELLYSRSVMVEPW